MFSMYSRYMSTLLTSRYGSNLACEAVTRHFASQQQQNCNRAQTKFRWCRHKMSFWLREQSVQVAKACTRQFEFIAAQRVRRSIQIFQLYTKIWDEAALREFIRQFRLRVARNAKNFIVGSVGMSMFNWEYERIPDEEMLNCCRDIDGLYRLRDMTVVCSKCHLRLVIDVTQPKIQYCQCHDKKRATHKAQQEGTEWEPFIEREDMLVWRKEEENFEGLYSYKVYGSFNDVSAEDFLQVQIDMEYRKKWDSTAKQLEVIDSDPLFQDRDNSGSDVIYWEMIWPKLFTNRDYVYQRRWMYDKDTGIVVIVSKGTDHPKAPNISKAYRVKTYWSCMVIKPHKSFQEPGIEFVMTYFDDPGVNIPSTFRSWVAASGLPDYLCRMRKAGKNYKNYKQLQETTNSITETVIISNEDHEDTSLDDNSNSEVTNENSPISTDNIVYEEEIENETDSQILNPTSIESDSMDESEKEENNSETNTAQEETQTLLDYIFLAKLFA